jgi:hypothetical protein
MKKFFRLTVLLALLLTFFSCGNSERESYDSIAYQEVLTSLVMEYTDLQTLSKSTGVSPEKLVNIKYGIIAENEDLTSYLRDLKYAYDSNDESEIESLLETHDFTINEKVIKEPLSIKDYKEQEYINNEKFQSLLPEIGQRFYNRKIHKFFEDKYSFIGIFTNTWRYVVNSKEEYIASFQSDFNKELSSEDFSVYLNQRINAYAQMLKKEHEVLYKKKTVDGEETYILELSNANFKLDKDAQNEIVKHATLDLYDFAVDVAEETVIAFIIWAIFAIIIEIKIEAAISDEISNFHSGIKKGDGWIKNGIRLGISLLGSYANLENKKKRIRKKYRNKQFLWSTLITIVLLVWSYYYVMKPSAEIEVNIENKMQQQVKEHFDNLNIWVGTELNKITKEL